MRQQIKNQITEYGYVFIREYSPELNTVKLARALGLPMSPWAGGLVQQLIPRATATPNTYSGMYGLDGFPFHTDLAHWRRPPHYLLLRCVKGHPDVRTLLIDGHTAFGSSTLDIMKRAIVKPRRPQSGAIPLLRLCDQVEDGLRFRWDNIFLKPASRIGEAASQLVRDIVSNADELSIALADAGDTLLIDNWRMLHARSPILSEREDRLIERIYLEGMN